jgi:outer membrane protein OmpA-like peptidoglycan-associated protein
MIMKTLFLAAGLALFGWAGSVAAQDAPLTADEIVTALEASLEDAPSAGLTRTLNAERVIKRRRVDLTIFFEPDSARITRRSAVQLEPLGRALQSSRLRRLGFTIIGHTDAAGSAGYNRKLSLKRAQAVRAHLARVYQINTGRLAVRGMGSDQLKDPSDPTSDINRRVEVAARARRI